MRPAFNTDHVFVFLSHTIFQLAHFASFVTHFSFHIRGLLLFHAERKAERHL